MSEDDARRRAAVRRDRTKSPHNRSVSGDEETASNGAEGGTRRKSLATLTASMLVEALKETSAGRRDRTKSPHNRSVSGDEETSSNGAEGGTRRKSLANFSASKLVETLKETSIENLVKRPNSSEETPTAPAAPRGPPSTRRVPGRSMSGQGPSSRAPQRRPRAADQDILSQSMDDVGNDSGHSLDVSAMSGSLPGRRRMPTRTKSQDSGLVRAQRTPRARRRPGADREDSNQDLSVSSEGVRRRLPARSKSSDGVAPARAPMRPARPGRRRPQAGDENDDDDEEEDIVISDSDEEDDIDENMDRSSRRRAPQRSRSSQDGSRATRTARAPRRRPSCDRTDGSPKRTTGPGCQRSLTGNAPPSSSSGHGLSRSQTTTNARGGARVRGGRDTARELAQFASNNRELSPEEYFEDDSGRRYSNSPIKSRSERRRLREGLRDVSSRVHGGGGQYEAEEEEVVLEKKKEEPWMRRLKKNVVEKGSNESVTGSLDDGFASNHSGGGFFPIDPTFGVFAATPDTPFNNDDETEYEEDYDGTRHLSIGDNKLDFSSIAN